jgi:2-polyprenyl-3-methyl-5-hydroxy-6-metoxy-1,4-benzoquinol methylase
VVICPLCESQTTKLRHTKPTGHKYFQCANCDLIFLPSDFHLTQEDEFNHYQTHNNDVFDPRYQAFVSPIVDYIKANIPTQNKGLDYGCGPGPVIAHLLKKHDYQIDLYDAYFTDNNSLNPPYDFIFACEVIEHFNQPKAEFEKIFKLLKPGGELIIMTKLHNQQTNFASWYYHLDPTHISFYSHQTLKTLQSTHKGTITFCEKDQIPLVIK